MPRTPAYPPPVRSSASGTRWPPLIWVLLLGTFAVRSAGFVYPFLSFRLAELSLSTAIVGYVLAAFGAGWLLGQLLCGWGADRYGRRTTLISAMAVAAVAMPALAWMQSTAAVFAAALVAGVVYDASRPITSAVIADVFPTESARTRVNAARHFAVNVGAGLTGATGGLLAGRVGTDTLFLINGVVCGVFGIAALAVMPSDHRPRSGAPALGAAAGGCGQVLRDGRLWLLWLASLAALTCCAAMFTALPMLMYADGLAASSYGLTQVVAAIVVIALSPIITPWLTHRAAAGTSMTGLFACSSLLLGIGMGMAGLVSTTPGYAVTVTLAVPGEIVLFIAASDILNRVSPADSRGLYAGIWGTTLAVAVIVSPLLAAWALNTGGGRLAGAAILACGLIGALLCVPLAALTRPKPVPGPPAAARHSPHQVPEPSGVGRPVRRDGAFQGS
ncbi:MFS transporter [Streptomyces sp. MS2.AVA.5]|uniref:MFS transporter n=1 Tax=Streptomyces achmelvichensis TaxID=3134111 RepID=A0ACC6Q8L6_9ACTN